MSADYVHQSENLDLMREERVRLFTVATHASTFSLYKVRWKKCINYNIMISTWLNPWNACISKGWVKLKWWLQSCLIKKVTLSHGESFLHMHATIFLNPKCNFSSCMQTYAIADTTVADPYTAKTGIIKKVKILFWNRWLEIPPKWFLKSVHPEESRVIWRANDTIKSFMVSFEGSK